MADDWWLGRLYASNLTPGEGGLGNYETADFARSIRHGVKPDGRPVLMMPSQYFYRFSDADLGALIAYLRALPPVDRELPSPRLGPFTRFVLFLGKAPDLLPAERIDHRAARPPPAPPGETIAYGAYLVETGGCKVCHREDLSGGLHPLSLPGEPPPADLTPGGSLAHWSERDFVRTLRTGTTPDGRRLDERFMPWRSIARLTDLELRAIWLYLRALPAH